MKIFDDIEKVLKKDDRLWSKDEKKKLLKNKLIELVNIDDDKLLGLLLEDKTAKSHFFKKIKDSTLFLKDKFLQFITMNEFLPDSFTAFENEIGLSEDKKLLAQKDEISLVFPHKDCFLEGGQTNEEVGREEIFYNVILAPDEIDRIKEPKVLVNWQKFDKNGKQEVKEISKQDNLVIKGNNLLTLYSLLPKYRGEIKLIYIDPPYNKNVDAFYNDKFNHSAWLTFMKNRLEVAKELLSEDGIIFVQIDDVEYAYLRVLMDEVFFRDNFISTITVKSKTPSGVGQESVIFDITERIIVFAKDSQNLNVNSMRIFDEIVDQNSKTVDNYNLILESFGKEKKHSQLQTGKGKPIVVYELKGFKYKKTPKKECTKEWAFNNFEKIFRISPANGGLMKKITPLLPKGPCCIEYTPEKGKHANKKIKVYFIDRDMVVMLSSAAIKNPKTGEVEKMVNIHNNWTEESLWQGIANEGGVKLKNGKKPERLLQRILDLGSNKDDIVLDFFAGAGTTGAVAHKMGRRYILVEQMDYIHDLPEQRLKNVINGDQTGISKSVNWEGGGSFIYTELLEWNQRYVGMLENAKTQKEILDIYKKIEKEQYYKYKYEPKKFDLKQFKELSVNDQKRALLDILDMNHLYVNRSSMEDATFKVGDKDKKLTKMFYKEN